MAGATEYLVAQGYRMTKEFTWLRPELHAQPTAREIDAIVYLAEEWDFGGLAEPSAAEPSAAEPLAPPTAPHRHSAPGSRSP